MTSRLLLLLILLTLVPACADRRRPKDDPKSPVLLKMPKELPPGEGD